MSEQLAERVEFEKTHMADEIEFDFSPEARVDWSEGVEDFQDKTPGELYAMLGLEKPSIPFFQEQITVESEISGQLGELEGSSAATEGFSLRWHQLVAVVKMMERAFTSQPILLMDDVGLGKTVQVLAFFAMLAYYREMYSQLQKYPGIWGKQSSIRQVRSKELINAQGKGGMWSDYAGRQAQLPDYPFLIVVPPALVEQVTLESARFLMPGSLEIIKIIGSVKQREELWKTADERSFVRSHMRLYIASTTVGVDLPQLV